MPTGRVDDETQELIFHQENFTGGINQQLDPTRIGNDEYFLCVNGINRYDVINPIAAPVLSMLNLPPNGHIQCLKAIGQYLVAFVDGKAYYRDVTTFDNYQVIAGFQMNPNAETIFAEVVPASTLNFTRVRASETTIASGVYLNIGAASSSLMCMVVQDGSTQPWIINTQAQARLAQTYTEWSDAGVREYIPIGYQMMFADGILYIVGGAIVDADKRMLFRSVSGRPLDFIVAVTLTGAKIDISEAIGGAPATAYAFDVDEITCLKAMNTPDGSFFASTTKNSHVITPDFTNTIFSEPTFRQTVIFNTGALNNESFIDILGDYAFIDYTGIKSFNAVLQFRVEGKNTPFHQRVVKLFYDPNTRKSIVQQVSSAITFDNYGFFAVQTIYGPAVLVYDTLPQRFSAIYLLPDLFNYDIAAQSVTLPATVQAEVYLPTDPPSVILPSIVVMFFDDFNGENGGVSARNYAGYINWDTYPTRTDLVDTAALGVTFPVGYVADGLCVDMWGTANTIATGQLRQKIALTYKAGFSYRVSFNIAGSQRGSKNSFNTYLAGLIDDTLTIDGPAPNILKVYEFTPTVDVTSFLEFTNTYVSGVVDRGCLLDNVKIEKLT